jgi:predicted dehydrogenase
MPRKLKVAVVGAGFAHSPDGRERHAVRTHLPALKKLPELFEVAAVCTTRMETAQESAKHFGVPHAFDSVERMLHEVSELDVVCISVRPDLHHQVTMPALRAGKHVYCEHPMGVTTEQGREMYALARQKGLRTIVGHQSHYEPPVLHMAELVRQGFIGKLLSFSHSAFEPNYIMPRPAHRAWLFQADKGGHPGYRTGHSLERLLSVIGVDVEEICADYKILVRERPATDTGGVIVSDQVDNMNYLIRAGGGLIGTMQVSITAWFGTGTRFELYGTEGMLMLSPDRTPDNWTKETGEGDPTRGELKLYGARVDMKRLLAEGLPPERLQKEFKEIEVPSSYTTVSGFRAGGSAFGVAQAWHAFFNAIHEGHECHPNFADVLKIHCILDAAEKSNAEGSWQRVDYSALAG